MEGRALLSTLFVDNSGGTTGTYNTIQEAVDASEAGDSIEVYPGTYDGGVVINKDDLTVESLQGLGTVFVVNTENLGSAFGFDVLGSGDTIRGFDISGFGFRDAAAGVFVGDPTLGQSASPVAYSPDNALIEGNDIHGNENGVYVFQADCAMITGNSIHDNFGGNGVILVESSDATVADNTITGSAGAGVRVEGGDCVMIQGNSVSFSQGDGIVVSGADDPTVADNDVNNNTRSGILVAGCDCPMVSGNTVHDSGRNGITVQDSADVSVDGNLSSDNAFDGIRLDRSSGEVGGNTARDNSGGGIRLVAADGVDLVGNTATTNQADGILVNASSNVTVEGNTANSNGAAGIHVADSFSIEVCDNTADDNSHGILVTGTTDSDISMNSAHGNAVLDIAWDGYGDNSFSDNSADTTNV
jgi:parallel beta-helix repeat protein